MAQDASEPDTAAAKPPRKWRGGLIWIGGLLVFAGGLIWLSRTTIAENLVADQLDQRDVEAAYRIESIGPRTQRIENVVIGNPDNPDLTARWMELDIGWTWSGPVVEAIRADGVRLYGRLVDGRLSFGEVDKLLPPPSREPVSLPNMAIALSDTRARIDMPWGQIGATVRGKGPLRDGFSGEVALIGEDLAAAGCSADTITAFGNLRITAGRPLFEGPLRGKNIRCKSPSLRLASIDTNLSAKLTAEFAGWSGSFDALGGDLAIAGGRSASSSIIGQFKGTAARTAVNFDAKANAIESALFTAQSFNVAGDLAFGADPLSGQAKLSLTGAALPPAQLSRLQALGANGGGPVLDLLGPLASAGRRALRNFDASADVALSSATGRTQIAVTRPTLRSASGAVLNSAADGHVTLTADRSALRWQASGDWTLAGGGLPTAQMQLSRSPEGQIRGRLRVAPITGKTSRLALKPVSISGDRAGNWSIASEASFSGSMGGARVEGLQMAFHALVDSRGNARLSNRCSTLALNSARIAGVTLGQNRLQLCGSGGPSLLAYRGGRLAGDVALIAPVIKGRSGENPLLVSAASGRYALASGNWSLNALSVALGEGDAASNFAAKQVGGETIGTGLAGTITQASGEIGTIPLDMRDFAGTWRFDQGLLTLAGRMMLSDQQNPRRFNPLSSQDVMLRFEDGKISANASFQELESGADVVRVELRHDFGLASGSADLNVAGLRFNSGFQPDQLTPLALGVIANADGTVAGRGRIDWQGSTLTSGGTFTTAGSNFAAAFGSVRGASTTLTFDDLIGMRSHAGQRISIDEINPGFPVIGGQIDYQLLDSNRIHIEGGRWPFAGGELRLKETILDFDENAVRRMEFELTGVDAAVFLTELGFSNINASGIFDGVLPVEFSGLGGRIVNGRLTARPGGGEVAYVGELSSYNLGAMANFAFNMLKSLRYERMEIILNGDLDGEMLTDVTFAGLSQGKGASRNFITRQVEKLPIVFNVRINAPFRQLITSAKSLYDPTQYIREQLPQLLEAERLKKNLPVQPRESDPVQ